MTRTDIFKLTKESSEEFSLSAASESPDPVLPRLKQKASDMFENSDFPFEVMIPVKIGSEIDAAFKLKEFHMVESTDNSGHFNVTFVYEFLGCAG